MRGGGGGGKNRCRVVVNKDQTGKQSDINTSNIAVLSSKRGGWGWRVFTCSRKNLKGVGGLRGKALTFFIMSHSREK